MADLSAHNLHEGERVFKRKPADPAAYDLDAYKEWLKNHSRLLDYLWGELYGSINIAQIDDGFITSEHADYLRKKFLFGGDV